MPPLVSRTRKVSLLATLPTAGDLTLALATVAFLGSGGLVASMGRIPEMSPHRPVTSAAWASLLAGHRARWVEGRGLARVEVRGLTRVEVRGLAWWAASGLARWESWVTMESLRAWEGGRSGLRTFTLGFILTPRRALEGLEALEEGLVLSRPARIWKVTIKPLIKLQLYRH